MRKPPPLDLDGAEGIAIAALGFLAGDAERLSRFLALTGIAPADLRRRAGEPDMLAAVLEHVLGDETLLLVLTSGSGIPPESVAPAAMLLQKEASRRGRA